MAFLGNSVVFANERGTTDEAFALEYNTTELLMTG
jgi:hypothetical protein